MKDLKDKVPYFKTKMKGYYSGVTLIALLCATSVSHAMETLGSASVITPEAKHITKYLLLKEVLQQGLSKETQWLPKERQEKIIGEIGKECILFYCRSNISDTERSKTPLLVVDLSGKYREYDEEDNFVQKTHLTWSDCTYWWNYVPRNNIDYAYHYARLAVDIWTKCNGINMSSNDLTKALNYAKRAQMYAKEDNIFPYLQNRRIDIFAINNLRINLEQETWNSRFFGLGYYIPLKNTDVTDGIKPEMPLRKKVLVAGFYQYRPYYKGALGIHDENTNWVEGVDFFGTKDHITNTRFEFWELTEQERFRQPYFSIWASFGSTMLCFFNTSKLDDYSFNIIKNYYNLASNYNNTTPDAIKIILLGIGDGSIGDLSKIEELKSRSYLFLCLQSAKEAYQKEYVTNMIYGYILEDKQRIKEAQQRYLEQKPKAEEYIYF
jgi:hypothetical protein